MLAILLDDGTEYFHAPAPSIFELGEVSARMMVRAFPGGVTSTKPGVLECAPEPHEAEAGCAVQLAVRIQDRIDRVALPPPGRRVRPRPAPPGAASRPARTCPSPPAPKRSTPPTRSGGRPGAGVWASARGGRSSRAARPSTNLPVHPRHRRAARPAGRTRTRSRSAACLPPLPSSRNSRLDTRQVMHQQ